MTSSCENAPVAADLNLQRTTYWPPWILLPVRTSLSSLSAATRGWLSCSACTWLNILNVLSHVSVSIRSLNVCHVPLPPHVSFPFSSSAFICLLPVAHSRTPSCLKSLKSCRWVRLILCIVWCLNSTTFLSSILYMSIRAAGSMSSGVNSLFLWRLVFNLKTHMWVWCYPCVDTDLFFFLTTWWHLFPSSASSASLCLL